MSRWVDINFHCMPLRSVARMTPPVDASDEVMAVFRKLRRRRRSTDFTIRITCTMANACTI